MQILLTINTIQDRDNMPDSNMFQQIQAELIQAIVQDVQAKKEVDRLYAEGKFHPIAISANVPSEENLDFDYARLRFIGEGSYTSEGGRMHLFQGVHWKLPFSLVRNGQRSSYYNNPRGDIGGIVSELRVKVDYDGDTGLPSVELVSIEQTVYAHR